MRYVSPTPSAWGLYSDNAGMPAKGFRYQVANPFCLGPLFRPSSKERLKWLTIVANPFCLGPLFRPITANQCQKTLLAMSPTPSAWGLYSDGSLP